MGQQPLAIARRRPAKRQKPHHRPRGGTRRTSPRPRQPRRCRRSDEPARQAQQRRPHRQHHDHSVPPRAAARALVTPHQPGSAQSASCAGPRSMTRSIRAASAMSCVATTSVAPRAASARRPSATSSRGAGPDRRSARRPGSGRARQNRAGQRDPPRLAARQAAAGFAQPGGSPRGRPGHHHCTAAAVQRREQDRPRAPGSCLPQAAGQEMRRLRHPAQPRPPGIGIGGVRAALPPDGPLRRAVRARPSAAGRWSCPLPLAPTRPPVLQLATRYRAKLGPTGVRQPSRPRSPAPAGVCARAPPFPGRAALGPAAWRQLVHHRIGRRLVVPGGGQIAQGLVEFGRQQQKEDPGLGDSAPPHAPNSSAPAARTRHRPPPSPRRWPRTAPARWTTGRPPAAPPWCAAADRPPARQSPS
jgi:hypothetical protein